MERICTYFLLFIIYSFCGWCIEVFCKIVSDHKFINRGFLIGPYCPIYGFGALLMTVFLKRYMNDPVTLFIMIILVCSILEYVTSYILEKLFKTRWWDYSTYRFSINGRICLETMVPFGIIGMGILYLINPFFFLILDKIPLAFLYLLTGILFACLLIDTCISFNIMSSFKNISSNIKTDSTEKITQLVKEEIIKRNRKLQKRLMTSFPKLEVLYSKGIQKKKIKEKKRR